MRDLVIGVTVVLADGTIANSGGRVVKNVAGYDLGKLFSGSRGRLGLIARLALRLHPLPPTEETMVVETDDPRGLWRELLGSQLDPERCRLPPARPGRAPVRRASPGASRPRSRPAPGSASRAGASGPTAASARPDAGSRQSFSWQECLLARPGTGVAYVAARGATLVGAGRESAGLVRSGRHSALMDRELIDDCVHCGFCLPTCPTYELWHEEMDSPRGRIWLMRATLDGTLELDRTVAEHFDRCLGCMACLTSCPSGVRYDRLIELARERVEREVPRPVGERLLRSLVFSVFPSPARLRWALRLASLPAPGPLAPLKALAPAWREDVSPPVETPAAGERVARVGLLTGCVQSVLFGEVNRASARVLAAYGYEVAAGYSGCCGALHLHAGRRQEGLELARRSAASLAAAGAEVIVTNAAGCGSHLKEAELELPVLDISEALVQGVAPELHPVERRVAFQESCHLGHAMGVREPPRALLRSIPGLELVEPAEPEICCGSAGIYNLVQPEAARELGDRKAARVLEVEPEIYLSANPGCLLQVSAALRRAGRTIPAAHPIVLLDASVRGTEPPLGAGLRERRPGGRGYSGRVFRPFVKGVGLALSPRGRKVIKGAVAVARSPEARQLAGQARKVATGPASRKLAGQALRTALPRGEGRLAAPENRERVRSRRRASSRIQAPLRGSVGGRWGPCRLQRDSSASRRPSPTMSRCTRDPVEAAYPRPPRTRPERTRATTSSLPGSRTRPGRAETDQRGHRQPLTQGQEWPPDRNWGNRATKNTVASLGFASEVTTPSRNGRPVVRRLSAGS